MSDPVLHILLSRVAEQTAQIEAVRALCEKRIRDRRRTNQLYGAAQPLIVSAPQVLRLLGGDPDEGDSAMGGADG